MTGSAFIIGSAIAAGAAVLGSTVNAVSQSHANKTQQDMMREQMSYQTSEREAAQEYNNPVNARKRFEAAGINPYFALGNIDAGSTTAMSAPGAPQLQAPQYGDILSALGSSVDSGINTQQQFQQSEQLQLGIEQAKVDTRYKLTQKLLDIIEQRVRIQGSSLSNEEKKKNLDLLDKQATRLQQDIDFTSQTWDDNVKSVIANRKIAECDADGRLLVNESQRIQNEFARSLGEANVKLVYAEVANQLSQVNLNNKHAANIVADTAIKKAQEKGVKIDNYHKNKINWLLREGVKLDNKAKKWDTNHPSYLDQIFGSAESLDKRTGLEHNKVPKIQGLSNSWTDNSGTTRW